MQCSAPFVGNGMVCGRDSDGDGYADMKLECDDPQCEQVRKLLYNYYQLGICMFILFIGHLCCYIQPRSDHRIMCY